MKLRNETERRSRENLKQMTRGRKHRMRSAERVVKYGAKSFARNAWLSVAAIAIMTITLVVIAATLVVTSAMGTAIEMVRAQVDMSVYVAQDAEQAKIDEIVGRMGRLASVREVKVVSPAQANREAIDKIIVEENVTDEDLIAAMREAPNKLPWTLHVKIGDLNETGELEDFVYGDESMEGMLDAKPPSFSSSHRETIDNIAQVMRGVEIGGMVAAGVFSVIAILVVFNTIRMAIFNRKEEIYMMKLIGASKGFVRGPFLVEAMMYGVLAGVLAGGLVMGAVSLVGERLGEVMAPTTVLIYDWWLVLGAGLVLFGMLIGVVSAMLATRKYLKLR